MIFLISNHVLQIKENRAFDHGCLLLFIVFLFLFYCVLLYDLNNNNNKLP